LSQIFDAAALAKPGALRAEGGDMGAGKLPLTLALAICVPLLVVPLAQACEMHGIWHQDCYPTPADDTPDHDYGTGNSTLSGPNPLDVLWDRFSNAISRFFSDLNEAFEAPARARRARERDSHVREMWQKGYAAFQRGNFDEATAAYCQALATVSSASECNRSFLEGTYCDNGSQTQYCQSLRSMLLAEAEGERQRSTVALKTPALGYASDGFARTEPPSPTVTYPTTLTEVRETLSIESRWVIDHAKRVLDWLPDYSADKIRASLIRIIYRHSLPNRNVQAVLNIDMNTEEECNILFDTVRQDLRERGELDHQTEQALDHLWGSVINSLREAARVRPDSSG
jgi:hypothetical protein